MTSLHYNLARKIENSRTFPMKFDGYHLQHIGFWVVKKEKCIYFSNK